MKKTIILLTLLILSCSGAALAQKAPTSRQLFMLLPNDYVNGTRAERAAALVFPGSIKADFLTFMISGGLVPRSLAGDLADAEGLGDLRVFRGRARLVVGLRYQLGAAGQTNPTIDSTRIVTVLLEYKDKKWTNVTDSLLPTIPLDEAHRTLTGFPDTKNAEKKDVWIETQVSKDRSGLLLVARLKGSDAATPLRFFKWNGARFVESE